MKKKDIKILEKVVRDAERGKISWKGVLAIWIIAKFNHEIEMLPKPFS